MARYTCRLTVAISPEDLHHSLVEILQACNFEIIYDTNEYMMAREVPGQITFSKLATAEVLVDNSKPHENAIGLNLVVKNEELALQVNNHCQQMYELLQQTIYEHPHWQILDLVQ